MKTIARIICITALLLTFTSAEAKKCRALALSGGGDKGAYEAAVFHGLYENLPAEELQYDVITGVSAGSLNTLALSTFDPTDVHSAASYMLFYWRNILTFPDPTTTWDILYGLMFKQGMFTLDNWKRWLRGTLPEKSVKRKVSFATVDSIGATYQVWDYNVTNSEPENIRESAMASSSIPGFLPPIKRNNYQLVDGGVIWNIDIDSAVRRCKEVVNDEKDIIIDMILCGNYQMKTVDDLANFTAMEHYKRAKEISDFYHGMDDYNSSIVQHPDVSFRYIIAPSEPLSDGGSSLSFDEKTIDRWFEIGHKDAKNAVELGSGNNGKILLEYTQKFKEGQDVWLDQMIDGEVFKLRQSQLKEGISE